MRIGVSLKADDRGYDPDVATSRRRVVDHLAWAGRPRPQCAVTSTDFHARPGDPATYGISLARAGVVVASPGLGVLFTLFAWGYAADRWGERLVITVGLTAAAVFLTSACFVTD